MSTYVLVVRDPETDAYGVRTDIMAMEIKDGTFANITVGYGKILMDVLQDSIKHSHPVEIGVSSTGRDVKIAGTVRITQLTQHAKNGNAILVVSGLFTLGKDVKASKDVEVEGDLLKRVWRDAM